MRRRKEEGREDDAAWKHESIERKGMYYCCEPLKKQVRLINEGTCARGLCKK